jgi:polyhydroxyalkanoate synthesis regulator protein
MAVATPKYPPILIRRYARNRLYDTVAGRYLTLEDLRQWVKKGSCSKCRIARPVTTSRACCWLKAVNAQGR